MAVVSIASAEGRDVMVYGASRMEANVMRGNWGLLKNICTKRLIWGFPKMGGTPKSSILIGFSIINQPFWGTPISAWALTPNFLVDCNQLRRIYLLSLGRLKTNGSLVEIFSAGIGLDLWCLTMLEEKYWWSEKYQPKHDLFQQTGTLPGNFTLSSLSWFPSPCVAKAAPISCQGLVPRKTDFFASWLWPLYLGRSEGCVPGLNGLCARLKT